MALVTIVVSGMMGSALAFLQGIMRGKIVEHISIEKLSTAAR